MESIHFVFYLVILLVSATLGTAKPTSHPVAVVTVSNEQKPTESTNTIDCSSNDLTIAQLKAIASNVSCPDNNDRKFWESACKCAVKTLPQSKCPQCRHARNVENNLSNNNSENQPTTPAPSATSIHSTTRSSTTTIEDKESINKKLRMVPTNSNATAAVGNSANFIRFGK